MLCAKLCKDSSKQLVLWVLHSSKYRIFLSYWKINDEFGLCLEELSLE